MPPQRDNLSYFAALLDGEGCIGWQSAGANRPRRFQMGIFMTDESVIDWVVEEYGGLKLDRIRREQHHKQQWGWRLTYRAAIELYTRVEPLLMIKHGRLKEYYEVPSE